SAKHRLLPLGAHPVSLSFSSFCYVSLDSLLISTPQSILQMRSVLLLVLPLAAAISLPGSNVNVASFDSVDVNRDGVIDGAEFEKWGEKKLHLKSDQRKNLFLSYDADRDGTLHISEFVPLAAAIGQTPQLSKHDIFDRLDRNSDGVVDASERSTSGIDAVVINGLVTVADMNGDGLLSRAEFDRATDQEIVKTQEEKNRELAVQLVTDMDANRDGLLALSELTAFATKFGKITPTDAATAFSQLDLNRDGFVDVNELARVPSKISSVLSFQAPPPVRSDISRLPPLRF
ncbi:hypothetical protein PENTCL1PPCAC_11143, partial [Pristionchus entomophagus]